MLNKAAADPPPPLLPLLKRGSSALLSLQWNYPRGISQSKPIGG